MLRSTHRCQVGILDGNVPCRVHSRNHFHEPPARALRAILENTMLNIMYEVPSLDNIDTCIITDEVISITKVDITVFQYR